MTVSCGCHIPPKPKPFPPPTRPANDHSSNASSKSTRSTKASSSSKSTQGTSKIPVLIRTTTLHYYDKNNKNNKNKSHSASPKRSNSRGSNPRGSNSRGSNPRGSNSRGSNSKRSNSRDDNSGRRRRSSSSKSDRSGKYRSGPGGEKRLKNTDSGKSDWLSLQGAGVEQQEMDMEEALRKVKDELTYVMSQDLGSLTKNLPSTSTQNRAITANLLPDQATTANLLTDENRNRTSTANVDKGVGTAGSLAYSEIDLDSLPILAGYPCHYSSPYDETHYVPQQQPAPRLRQNHRHQQRSWMTRSDYNKKCIEQRCLDRSQSDNICVVCSQHIPPPVDDEFCNIANEEDDIRGNYILSSPCMTTINAASNPPSVCVNQRNRHRSRFTETATGRICPDQNINRYRILNEIQDLEGGKGDDYGHIHRQGDEFIDIDREEKERNAESCRVKIKSQPSTCQHRRDSTLPSAQVSKSTCGLKQKPPFKTSPYVKYSHEYPHLVVPPSPYCSTKRPLCKVNHSHRRRVDLHEYVENHPMLTQHQISYLPPECNQILEKARRRAHRIQANRQRDIYNYQNKPRWNPDPRPAPKEEYESLASAEAKLRALDNGYIYPYEELQPSLHASMNMMSSFHTL